MNIRPLRHHPDLSNHVITEEVWRSSSFHFFSMSSYKWILHKILWKLNFISFFINFFHIIHFDHIAPSNSSTILWWSLNTYLHVLSFSQKMKNQKKKKLNKTKTWQNQTTWSIYRLHEMLQRIYIWKHLPFFWFY